MKVRCYPDNLLKDEMVKHFSLKFLKLRSKSNRQESKGDLLVTTFHPKFELIGQLLNKHLHVLYMDQETKNVFTLEPWLHLVVHVSSVVPW